jgi:hypothetical protein
MARRDVHVVCGVWWKMWKSDVPASGKESTTAIVLSSQIASADGQHQPTAVLHNNANHENVGNCYGVDFCV